MFKISKTRKKGKNQTQKDMIFQVMKVDRDTMVRTSSHHTEDLQDISENSTNYESCGKTLGLGSDVSGFQKSSEKKPDYSKV